MHFISNLVRIIIILLSCKIRILNSSLARVSVKLGCNHLSTKCWKLCKCEKMAVECCIPKCKINVNTVPRFTLRQVAQLLFN